MNIIKKIQPVLILILAILCISQIDFFENKIDNFFIERKIKERKLQPLEKLTQASGSSFQERKSFVEQMIATTTYQEEFVYRVLNLLRFHGSDSITLKQSDIDSLMEKNKASDNARKISNQVNTALQYDYNVDGKIDKAELKIVKVAKTNKDLFFVNQYNKIIELDSNNDGIITMNEMVVVKEDVSKGIIIATYKNIFIENLKSLLDLDPNKDGVLTLEELKNVAVGIFQEVDTDKNGILSAQEKEAYKKLKDNQILALKQEENQGSEPNNLIRSREEVVFSDCAFSNLKLPAKFNVFAAGGQSRAVKFQIDQSGSEAGQINATVNSPNEPVVLMFGSYYPTIWNINWSPNTKIIAVLVSGYHRQTIAGLDKKVPVLNSSYDNNGSCDYYGVDGDELKKLNPLSRKLFGKQVDMVYFAKNGSVMIGNPLSSDVKLINSPKITPESFYDKSAPLAGTLGLEDAVNKGFLRPATEKDTQAWLDLIAEKNSKTGDVPPTNKESDKRETMGTYRSYVVLKPFVYPEGLYGGFSATFFIPKGVKAPTGNPGHSDVYDFNTLSCKGALCSRN